MISQKEINSGRVINFTYSKIYILNTLLHFVDSGFWLIAIVGTLLKAGSLQKSALFFSYFLLFESIFNIIFSLCDQIVSRKSQSILGMTSFSVGSMIFLDSSENSQIILAFLLFGIGIAAINGSAPAWFIELKNRHSKACTNALFHGKLNYCRRIGQLLNIPVGMILGFKAYIVPGRKSAAPVLSLTAG